MPDERRPREHARSGPPKVVLCVEEERIVPLIDMLEQLGYVSVGEATRGIETVMIVAEHYPEVAIIDVALVGGLGLRLFKVIEAVAPDCVIIALSPMDTLDLAALEAGAHAAIPERDLSRLRRVLTTLAGSRNDTRA